MKSLFNRCYNAVSMKGKRRDYTVDAVVRSLVILEALAKTNREMGVLEISKTVKIHVSTVYRLLHTLIGRGFVNQNPETEKYCLGIKVFELGMARIRQMDFRAVALPYLKELNNTLGETVFLGILRGHEVLIIETFSAFRGILFRSQVGAGEPLYCTGIGKALLAHLPPEAKSGILKQIKLEKFTPNTLTRKRDLQKELKLIRQRRYSLDNEEIESGVKCVAAPIINHDGYAVAAFSVAGPAHRIESQRDKIIECVLHTSRQINWELGYPSAAAAQAG